MRWKIKGKLNAKEKLKRRKELILILLKNRGLETKKQQDDFFSPKHPRDVSYKEVGLELGDLKVATQRIEQAHKKKDKVLIYGDYDADGICATAILWQVLNKLGLNVVPFIPRREEHGYGLSREGLAEVFKKNQYDLVITVDNGIMANEEVGRLKKMGVDTIVTDHHQKGVKEPEALAVLHSDKVAGAGVAWFFSRFLIETYGKRKADLKKLLEEELLGLAALGTVADVMTLLNVNRSVVKYGLKELGRSKNPGIAALKQVAGIDGDEELSTYHIGFVLAPRINAMGRLEDGMDALRLLCTTSKKRAQELAYTLNATNKIRQELTDEMVLKAEEMYELEKERMERLIVVGHKDFHEGVIGLIAGKLTQKYYRPSIVFSLGEKLAKGSARSIDGVNIIEVLRQEEALFESLGGHPGAAGMSVKVESYKKVLESLGPKMADLDDSLFEESLEVDCEIKASDVNRTLWGELEKFAPFGVGNPKPVFAAKMRVLDSRVVGREGKHLKLVLGDKDNQLDAIAFSWGWKNQELSLGEEINVVFSVDLNRWNGREKVQMMVSSL